MIMNNHFKICAFFYLLLVSYRSLVIVTNCLFRRRQSPFCLNAKSIRKLAETHCKVIRSAAGPQIERFVSELVNHSANSPESPQSNDPDVYLLSG